MKPTFDETKERAAQDGSEWLYGAVETDLASIPLSVRIKYAPDGVLQFNDVMDSNECATFGPENILEAKFDYFYDNGMHPDLKRWVDQQGYRKTGRFVFSKAFIGILSGTTQQGNSLKAPLDAILKYGLIPELLPLQDGMTWDDYMNRKRITQAMLDLGQEWNRRFGINYEKVYLADILSSLSDDLLDVAAHGWSTPINNIYPRTEDAPNHAFALLTPAIDAFDNYVPFVKRLATDYKFFDWGYSLSVTRQTPYPDETAQGFSILQKLGLLKFFPQWLLNLLSAPLPAQPTPMPTEAYDWSNPTAVRHSVRVICDEMLPITRTVLIDGKLYLPKDIITACIQQESQFNPKAIGKPNENGTTDYGLCQYNNGHNAHGQAYWIGPGAAFASVEEVLNDPEKNVRIMCAEYKAGHISRWSSYSTGAYKKYL